ncbi:hypothetical protein [Gillisia hiemivivida]|uniref:Uncharacterized protein n=1 Tax=Gillisia hiemivivida TaxID=291190 RepID=A0A5C6ZUN5_9FLAO|nr:hypothetical protein [Gillisia hiemivivida]TXD93622.1 hypothetical protein ES724_09350 [Gillisia hiemivivida]
MASTFVFALSSFTYEDPETYDNCGAYSVAMANNEDSSDSQTYFEDIDYWNTACEDAGGCPCTILDPVYLSPN